MIFQISTQWMKDKKWNWRYEIQKDIKEQNKRRQLMIRIYHLDIFINLITRIGKFRRSHGI